MTWKGILEDVVTRHTIYVASNKDVWNPRPSTKTQGLSRDQAQKLCPPYIIDSTCLLSTKVEIEYRGRGDRQKARLNIHPCPDPKLSLGDLGPIVTLSSFGIYKMQKRKLPPRCVKIRLNAQDVETFEKRPFGPLRILPSSA